MSTLEGSVTLEDVFSVVEAKRVPLAPELAGYLTLEVADGSQAAGGEVDARTVYISEEGTVALVRPKKDSPAGDAETSVRAILAKLLDASGSATPALSASAKRKPGVGLPALVSELEAALIPVNRAAGRRALARLAREVKRVTLGVGRNASVPPPANRPAAPRTPAKPIDDVMSGPDAPPGPRQSVESFPDEALTADRVNQAQGLASNMHVPDSHPTGDAPKPPVPLLGLTPPPVPGAPAAGPRTVPPPPPARGNAALRAPPRGGSAAVAPPPRGKGGPAGAPGAEPDKLFGGDEVDSLLSTFEVSNVAEKQVRNELKAIAGLDPTPGPPDATTLAELTKDVGKDLPKRRDIHSVESLLALADSSGSLNTPQHLEPAPIPPKSPPKSPPEAPRQPPPQFAPPPTFAQPAPLTPPPAPREPPQTVERLSPAPLPAVAAAAVDAAVKRPLTPARALPVSAPVGTGRQPKPESPSGTGKHAKSSEAPPALSSNRRPKVGGRTTGANFRQPRAPRTGLAMLVLTLLVLVAGGAAVWMFKPAFFTGKKKTLPTATVSTPVPVAQPARCKVALVVGDVPANAEILLRMGQAPLDVERMPVGTRLEFVATAEGYAPRRAVIKGESPWDKAPDGKPRIDVPIQLDPTKAKAGSVDPWPVAEPGSQVGGSGSPGTVHVVSNVRGAEVWLLAGLGPEARIEQLRCDGDIDVLLAGPPQLRKRLHVGEKEIQAAAPDPQGNRVVSVSGK
jgi:hypothetical protein